MELNLDFTHRGRAPVLQGCRQNKQMVQCPSWPEPAPELSQHESEMFLAPECGLCCPRVWALSLAWSQLGGYAALGTLLGCQFSPLTLPSAAAQRPLLQRLGLRVPEMLEGQASALKLILKVPWRSDIERALLGKMTKLIYRSGVFPKKEE